ncbi:hypothetical protein [Pseudomonas sp. zfem003]|uniref:hypothetical protein n=1 Tax=Pseudomonas sp. zfem003 TaxID=3078198 RepID=UPI00292A236A|nr:hypothetical protein [Pseudomonas sp. zfem003]MDU9399622.1 hypothetical protein [Pseudomonas sp. zfem003]
MAFMLSEIDLRPMRAGGRTFQTALANCNSTQPPEKGVYRGQQSGAVIEVISAGGTVTAASEAKLALSIIRPVPVAFKRMGDGDVPLPVDEIFVQQDSTESFRRMVLSNLWFEKDLMGFWLPVEFFSSGTPQGPGWVRALEDCIEGAVPVTCDTEAISFTGLRAFPFLGGPTA